MTEHVSGAAPAKRRSDLAVRAAAGLVMIAVALTALYAGGRAFWLLVTAATLLMMAEWAGLMHASRGRMTLAIVAAGAVMLTAGSLASTTYLLDIAPLTPGRVAAVCVAAAVLLGAVTLRPRLGAGLLYVTWPALALLYLRGQPQGLGLALWTLAIVWATDIGAYFAGRAIGGPKLSPAISPNKTWAGLIGGVLAALAVGYGIALVLSLPALLLVLGAPMAVLAQAGDLFESWLKRRAGVKDSGHILPGHGGVLDRLDGLVPVAVAVALLLMTSAL